MMVLHLANNPSLFFTTSIFMFIYISFYCSILWRARKEPSIAARNPPALLLSALGNLVGSILILSSLLLEFNCPFLNISKASFLNLHAFPFVLRSFHYVIQMEIANRELYSWIFNHRFSIALYTLIFSIINFTVTSIFTFTLESYKHGCGPSFDLIYLIVVVGVLLYSVYRVSGRIPWSYDVFKISREIRIIFWIWFALGTPILGVDACFGSQGNPIGMMIVAVLFVMLNNAVFIVSTVWPLHAMKSSQTTPTSRTCKKGARRTEKTIFQAYACFSKCDRSVRKVHLTCTPTLVASPSNSCDNQSHAQIPVFQGCSSFDEIVVKPAALDAAHDFFRKIFCPEIPLFLSAVHKYKYGTLLFDEEEVYKSFYDIMETFILTSAPFEVNISGKLRQEIQEISSAQIFMQSCSDSERQCIFDEIYHEVENLFWNNLKMNASSAVKQEYGIVFV